MSALRSHADPGSSAPWRADAAAARSPAAAGRPPAVPPASAARYRAAASATVAPPRHRGLGAALPGPPADSVRHRRRSTRICSIACARASSSRTSIERGGRPQLNWYRNHPDYLERTCGRAELYLYYIVSQLEARNMPLELALLPVVESAFEPYAYSRARAAGLWQFIPGHRLAASA